MNNFINMLRSHCSNVFPSENNIGSKPKILCILPNLSLNGAQIVFIEALELLIMHKDCDYYILSPEDGDYRDIYLKMGCTVCIRPYIAGNDKFRSFIQNSFTAVFLNTALVHGYSLFFVNTEIPVFWWIHESLEHMQNCCQDMVNPNLLSKNIHIYSVSSRVAEAFIKLYDYHTKIMHMCIKDVHNDYLVSPRNSHVVFFIPAAYTPVKGQDILLSAISELPHEYQDKAAFIFCGYCPPDNKDYFDKITKLSSSYDCISHIGQLNKKEMYQHYVDCDCVIAPSRTDPNPATVIEGMMFHRLALVSDKTGISEFITDCVNGFVFKNTDELVKRLMLIISEKDKLKPIAEKGYLIWKKHYSPENTLSILLESGVF